MKRIGFLYERITDPENIKRAIIETAKGKKYPRRFKRYIRKADYYAEKVKEILDSGDYSVLGNDREFDLEEGYPRKLRHIQAPRFFPDQIIHRAVCNIIEPIILKGRDKHSHCAIKGRGAYSAFKDIRNSLRKYPKDKWCLKADISKFYPSIDRETVFAKLKTKIKDEKVLALCHAIIFQAKGTGLPIGYATSPRFAEMLLESTDHAIREKLGIKCYCRYADDMVIRCANKRRLKEVLGEIEKRLAEIDLRLKGSHQLFDIRRCPIDFVGYRYWHGGYVRIRKHIFSAILSLVHRVRKIGHATISQCESYLSRMAMFLRCGSMDYYLNEIRPCLPTGRAKSIISHFAKRKMALI